MKPTSFLSFLIGTQFAPSVLAAALEQRDDITATVNLAMTRGSPKHLGSGFIYGIPDKANQVPDHWYTDMGFNYGRAGGAQLGAPARGWIYGMADYRGRLQSTLSNYWTCRKYGANFIILPHDIWGTDGATSSTVWPGDNGDWSDYDAFLTQLTNDLVANNALDGLVFDIWNEPDLGIFWNRSQQQWIDLYIHTHKFLRNLPAFKSVLVSGPSLAGQPFSSNSWWTKWLAAIAANNAAPDQWSYHLEGGLTDPNNDLQNTDPSLTALLKTYNLPTRQVNINEYGTFPEQVPTGAAWWLSRLERYDAIGLRGNWASGTQLHDLFANTLTKINDPRNYLATDYAPAPEYQVYKYYNQQMTGLRVATTGSADRLMDVYATTGSNMVRILCGVRINTGTWAITVNNLSSVGLPTSGSLTIQTWGFDGTSVTDIVNAPSDRGLYTHTYSGNSLTFPIYQTDKHTAWAFEFKTNLGGAW